VVNVKALVVVLPFLASAAIAADPDIVPGVDGDAMFLAASRNWPVRVASLAKARPIRHELAPGRQIPPPRRGIPDSACWRGSSSGGHSSWGAGEYPHFGRGIDRHPAIWPKISHGAFAWAHLGSNWIWARWRPGPAPTANRSGGQNKIPRRPVFMNFRPQSRFFRRMT